MVDVIGAGAPTNSYAPFYYLGEPIEEPEPPILEQIPCPFQLHIGLRWSPTYERETLSSYDGTLAQVTNRIKPSTFTKKTIIEDTGGDGPHLSDTPFEYYHFETTTKKHI